MYDGRRKPRDDGSPKFTKQSFLSANYWKGRVFEMFELHLCQDDDHERREGIILVNMQAFCG